MKFLDSAKNASYVDATEEDVMASIALDDAIEATREAYRNTKSSGVCGMSIDAQTRSEYAKEIAVIEAVISTLEKYGFEIVRIKT